MDLLISALNNIRREMSFFEITATKYGIQLGDDPPSHITRSWMDLFIGVSSPGASLLEGLVVLWATEHVRSFISSHVIPKILPYDRESATLSINI